MNVPEVEAGKPGSAKFRLRKVLMVVVPVAVLALVVVALAGFIDVDALLSDLSRPALAPATGQVLFQGQPLAGGQVTTQPVGGRGVSALGWTDDEGKFSLKTDVRGVFVDGATVGEHLVTVAAFKPAPGPGAPALLTPQQYASAGTSPLRITIRSNPADNQFQFVLEGDVPSRPQGAGQGGGKGKGKSKAKTETPTPAEPEASAETTGATENKSKSEPGENRETESKAENESAKTPADKSDDSDALK